MYDRNILIEQTDPELFKAIQQENARQEHHIELIASENYASPAVMAAQGTQLTNNCWSAECLGRPSRPARRSFRWRSARCGVPGGRFPAGWP